VGVGDGDRIVTIHPACRGLARRWPEGRFADLADRLVGACGVRVILVSGPGEQAVSGRVGAAMRRQAIDLGGRLGLQELAALFSRSALFIGLDGGAVHIAAAVGSPVLALYGTTSDTWRPWTNRGRLIRGTRPCSQCDEDCRSYPSACMESIGVDDVFGAALGLLQDG